MSKKGKKYQEVIKNVDKEKQYSIEEASELVKKLSYVKFNATIELHIKTGADPKYNDQMIRGTISLPHGTGKTVRVGAFVADDKVEEAKKAGAFIAGNETIIKDIQAGKFEFDILIASSDMMRDLAKVAKDLGPKGLMPSPKAGTVTNNITQTIGEIIKGRIEFKLDKTGNLHIPVGKADFDVLSLKENIETALKTIEEAKPSGIKGKLYRKIFIAPTMGPSIQIVY